MRTWLAFDGPAGRRDPLRDAFFLVAGLTCLGIAFGLITGTASDALGWYVFRLPDPYEFRDYSAGYGFYFTPPIAFAIYPLVLLPLPLFAAAWIAIGFAALYYLVGRWAALVMLVPPVFAELHQGNVNLLLAAASLLMLRWPGVASFLVLTKVTPGIAILWFAVRREWRSLAIALGTTALIVLVTLVIAPGLWVDWYETLSGNLGTEGSPDFAIRIPLVARLLAAMGLVTWGALTSRRWTLPLAVTLAAPTLWFNVLAGAVGVVRGIQLDRQAAASATTGLGARRER